MKLRRRGGFRDAVSCSRKRKSEKEVAAGTYSQHRRAKVNNRVEANGPQLRRADECTGHLGAYENPR
jgi:hypothetical protein